MAEPDKEAAQQLVQLSGGDDEEESKGLEHNDCPKKEKEKEEEGEGEDMRAKISAREKKEKEDEHWPRKRRRFRSLASIYKETRPTSNAHHGSRKKRRQRGKEKGSGD